MKDTLPNAVHHQECGVINLDNDNGPGTHWVAYIKKGGCVEYFDSFGNLRPPLEVVRYLGKNIEYNYNNYQQFDTFICGHLCLNFLLNKINIP